MSCTAEIHPFRVDIPEEKLTDLRRRITATQWPEKRRHFAWMCALARMIGVWDCRQAELFKRMSDERDNLWIALDYCRQVPGAVEAGAEAAQHPMVFWAARGQFGDVRRVLTSLAEVAPENSVPRGRLLWVASVMAASQNDYDAAAELSDESLRIGIETKDVEVVAWSLIEGAIPRWMDGDIAAVTERFESALSLARLMGVEQAELNALQTLCGISITSGDLDRAVELGEQSLAMSKDRGELWARLHTELPGPGVLAARRPAARRGTGPRGGAMQARG